MKKTTSAKTRQVMDCLCILILVVLIIAVVVWGIRRDTQPVHSDVSDTVQEIDWDNIFLEDSGVEVSFSEVILSKQNEMRKLIVVTQKATVSSELTDRLIEQLDFNFLKKTQSVSYTGTGYFVVNLDQLTAANVIEDAEKKTVTIRIGHPYLETVSIDPDNIIIDEVKEGLLARGDIRLTVKDLNTIEKDLRTKLEAKFNTAESGQEADENALRMVKEIYEPVVKAIDRRYDVIVTFQ